MTYLDQFHPWCIIRPLPNMQRFTIARFRRRGDAEAYLRILRQNAPNLRYTIMFDSISDPSTSQNGAKHTTLNSQK